MKHLGSVLAIVLGSSVIANAQTLADKAREERAKKQGSAIIVIDNKTIKNTTGEITTGPAAPAATTPALPEAPSAPAQHDEKWWREQFAKARDDIKKADIQIALLEGDVKDANRDFLTRAYDPGNTGQKNVAETQAKLEAAKAQRTKLQERLAKLEDDLRRSGQPASWSR
jgi:hypothetical protein